MKITKQQLKQLIKEEFELSKIEERMPGQRSPEKPPGPPVAPEPNELTSTQVQAPPSGAVARGNTKDTLLHKKIDNVNLYLKLISEKLDRVLKTLGQKAGTGLN